MARSVCWEASKSGHPYSAKQLCKAFPPVEKAKPVTAQKPPKVQGLRLPGVSGFGQGFDADDVKRALAALPIKGFKDRVEWMKVIQAVHYGSGGSEEGLELVWGWSAGDPHEFDEDDLRKLWDSLSEKGSNGEPVTLRTLFALAKEHGYERDTSERTEDLREDKQSVTRTAQMICMADVKAKPVSWLWRGRIAKGAVNFLVGEPSQGKSQICCDMTARLTTGRPFPASDGEKPTSHPPQRVIMLNCEDATDTVIKPRLMAAGADLSRVHTIQSVLKRDRDGNPVETEFSLAQDISTVDRVLQEYGDVGLLTIDPISAYLGAQTDTHNNASVRAMLAPLSRLAEKHNVAILCVSHLNKGSGDQKALNRISGSGAFGAAARSVLAVGPNLDDDGSPIDGERVLISLKSNLGKTPDTLVYCIEGQTVAEEGCLIETSRIHWVAARDDMDADQVLRADGKKKKQSALDRAVEWLKNYLGSGYSNKAANDVIEAAEANGISERTLQRAREQLKIDPRKDGKGGWRWIYNP